MAGGDMRLSVLCLSNLKRSNSGVGTLERSSKNCSFPIEIACSVCCGGGGGYSGRHRRPMPSLPEMYYRGYRPGAGQTFCTAKKARRRMYDSVVRLFPLPAGFLFLEFFPVVAVILLRPIVPDRRSPPRLCRHPAFLDRRVRLGGLELAKQHQHADGDKGQCDNTLQPFGRDELR